jgi:DUF4097 and DUF4098 domain-containing protein YvlB
MRRTLIFTLALLAAAPVFATADDVIKKGFNVADGGTLRLDADFGDVTIVSGGTGVAVEIIRDADGREGEERLREHKIEFTQQGNDVIISTPNDRHDEKWFRWFDWSDFEVKWNIRVPKNYNLHVRTSGGSIELDNVGGAVDASTSGGSIKTGRLGGIATLRTSGGSITIDGAAARVDARTSGGSIRIGDTDGPCDVRTSGGSITLARVRGSVVARTSGGGISIEEATGSVDASTSGGSIKAKLSGQLLADSKLSTSGGGITVSIAPNVAADLDARASGGGVSSDVPITVQGTMDDDELRGKINGGGPKLTLRTSGGGIRVKTL